MDRRGVLQSVMSAVGATGLIGASSGAMAATPRSPHPARIQDQARPFVKSHDHVDLFYRDWGTGRPLIFLAPWGLHSGWWEYQMAYLSARGARCIAYDRRGHGRSVEPVGGYNFDVLADDLAAVIEQLDLRDVTLVAQSLGCGEVVRYLSRHGSDRIARVVMVAPITPQIVKSADNPTGVDASYLQKVREVLSTDRAHAIADSAAAFFGAPKNPVSTEMMTWWTDMLLQCSLKVLLELHRVFTITDFSAQLRTIALSTLIIHGDNDTSTPLDITGRRTASLIPGSRLTVYEGAAHGLPITHMDRLNRDLLAFSG
jgi:pimeloyl-ACP methyl ester carboxylesterase